MSDELTVDVDVCTIDGRRLASATLRYSHLEQCFIGKALAYSSGFAQEMRVGDWRFPFDAPFDVVTSCGVILRLTANSIMNSSIDPHVFYDYLKARKAAAPMPIAEPAETWRDRPPML